ncbi:RCC1/BLIP-II [Karstenula rhodostoma CBS 690.94]|uniref:RCC1/BLIP-II n=1 Tax=Karstenula rhodostoma CBS 690.94 TaxID=1392251 RepID=A0A9P4PH05_9PLEO|nr:RCC1/BLIP-II [Karstenula rhodostoma CBS 690.94]
MPPRANRAATAAAKEATPTVNGTSTSTSTNNTRPQRGAARAVNGVAEERKSAPPAKSRAKKDATPAVAPKALPKRKKEAENASEAETDEPAPKRKKDEDEEAAVDADGDVDMEPQPKKAKTTTAPTPKRDPPKGPRRPKGKKIEVNPLRYTEPLKVFVFGEGGQGELGLGATKKAIDVKRPRWNEALSNQDIVRIATGGMHVVALTKDNKILTWGVNDNGALGRETSSGEQLKDMKEGDDEDSDSDSDDETGGLNPLEATPTAVSADHFPEDTVFVDITAGDSCSFALTTEGAVYGWGTFRKNEGILGFARNNETANTPVYIDSITKVTQLACGTNHVLALTKDRHVFAWGNGQQNQLGRRVTERNLNEALVPSRLGFHDTGFKRPSQRIAQIACGDYHGLAIAEDGHIWSWGANNYCETGHGENAGEDNASVLTPRIIPSLEGKGVTTLEGGSHHNIAITQDGEVLIWGRCDGSQTGIPPAQLEAIDDEDRVLKSENGKPKILIEPTVIPGLSNIVTGACGPEHTIVINKDGKAYSWGFSANYQTGQGTDDDIETPTLIDNTAVRDVKLIWAGAGGQYSALASKRD